MVFTLVVQVLHGFRSGLLRVWDALEIGNLILGLLQQMLEHPALSASRQVLEAPGKGYMSHSLNSYYRP